MKLVVGLGNPGARYSGTRHNAGFLVVDSLHAGWARSTPFAPAFGGQLSRASLEGSLDVLLLKPQTFMNRSGQSVAPALAAHGLAAEDLLVLHDDLDLDFGTVRIKVGGGSGGHRGLESCFAELGTSDFARIRVGIGRPRPGLDPVDYVLEQFDQTEREALPGVVALAADAARETLRAGAPAAMNRFNRRRTEGAEP